MVSFKVEQYLKIMRAMRLKSSKGCRLAIGRYPYFIYDASDGGGETALLNTTDKNLKAIKFCPNEFKIPPLNWKTTKFLSLPLPPGINIKLSLKKLEGTLNEKTGEIILDFEARFTLHILSILRFPDLIIKSILNTRKVQTKFHRGIGQTIQKDGKTKIVGIAKIPRTTNFILNNLLNLPTEAIAELKCEVERTYHPYQKLNK